MFGRLLRMKDVPGPKKYLRKTPGKYRLENSGSAVDQPSIVIPVAAIKYRWLKFNRWQ